MARSIYVMPIIQFDWPKYGLGPREKYWSIVSTYGTRARFDYGNEPWTLVGVEDISPADNATLVGNPDVFKLPDNLDQTMGSTGNRNQTRNALESVNMPGNWIATSDTYRTVVRFVGALCQFMMGYTGRDGTLLFASATLSTTYSALTQSQRDVLLATTQAFGLSTTTLTGANTLRTILKALGDDYVAQYVVGTNPMTGLDLAGPL